ncbi:sensor histidine kinase [Marinobacter caseinilyticus]|uniref:sensor histidine kinase n=1 Tax=Marinobacter caseinilyticus TaxID=2692195 RepID=UPI001408C60A|nr:HAMP domain-containing sensor histidine kinase [Marinobacter caseinilyticus]
MKLKWSFPLFWRIFLLIWLAMAFTVVASNMATRELIDRERLSIERQEGLRGLASEAVNIRESEGRGATWRYLKEQGRALDLHLVLIDSDERGDELPKSIRERMGAGWHRYQPAVINVEKGYRLIAWPRLGGEGWLDPRMFRMLELGLGFVIITLACWWVARRISQPLRHVETTAQAIAHGDLSQRVSQRIAGRHDEIGALAQAFNGMTEQLCTLLERQKHLLRDISHDLRTPLARQRIAIELAADGQADPELMASILRQNERLEAMTSQILTLYRVLEKGGDIEREPVHLASVINRVLGDAADYAEHRQVDCHLTVSTRCQQLTVLGDAGLLQRALDNVLQNALDHTPPGHTVSLSLSERQGRVLCDIADSGPGAPVASLAQLFEPFYRTDEARSGHGWGLGLAIAKDIMTAHDGSIGAVNGPKGGLVVSLVWPVFTQAT